MTSGGGYLQRPQRLPLSLDLIEINIIVSMFLEYCADINHQRLYDLSVIQKFDNIRQSIYSQDNNPFDYRRFGGVFSGDKNFFQAQFFCFQGGRQYAPHTFNASIQGKFADKEAIFQRFFFNQFLRGENPDGDGQIKARAFFFYVGGGQIDCHMTARKAVTGIFYCCFDSVPAFFNGSVGQANRGKLGQTVGYVNFHRNGMGFHPDDTHTKNFNEHLFCPRNILRKNIN